MPAHESGLDGESRSDGTALVSPETLAGAALGEVSRCPRPVAGINPSRTTSTAGWLYRRRVYTGDNPTFEHAERSAALEGAGCACALFASGWRGHAVFQSLLPGDHCCVPVLYWGVRKWLAEFALTWGWM